MLTFFVALAVVSLGFYVAWPLLQSPPPGQDTENIEASLAANALVEQPVEVEESRLQRVLAELDFDHSTGKTNDEDWQQARGPIEAQLERLATAETSGESDALDRELELEIHIARARLRLRSEAQPV